MRKVVLKFILEFGSFLQVIVTDDDAKKIIQSWLSGEYELKGVTAIGDVSNEGSWAVSLDSIKGVHTMEIAQTSPLNQTFLPGKVPPGSSGVQM